MSKPFLIGKSFNTFLPEGVDAYEWALLSYLKSLNYDYQSMHFHNRNPFLLSIFQLSMYPHLLLNHRKGYFFHALSAMFGHYLHLFSGSVVTIHDLIPQLSPEYVKPRLTLYYDIACRLSCKTDHIICNSTQTKQDVIDYYSVDEGKITIIPHGVEDRYMPLGITNDQHKRIGYLGRFDPRRHIEFFIGGIKQYKKDYGGNTKFDLWGPKTHNYNTFKEMIKRDGIQDIATMPGFAPSKNKPEIYNSFDVFVFPSMHEGFGLPILEAQACGVPVIIQKDARIPRELADSCMKAESEKDLAEKMHALLTDKKLHHKYVQMGLENAKKYTWENTCKKTIEVYKKIGVLDKIS